MGQIKRYRKKKIKSKQKTDQLKSAMLKLSLISLNFIFATFAWFTYTKILNPAVDVNVSAWQVEFNGEDVSGTSMGFTVGTLYPGMADQVKEVEIINLGDRAAAISYRLDTLKILGKTYTVKEAAEPGDDPQCTVYKSVDTVYKLDESDEIVTDIDGNPIVEKYITKLLNNSTKYPFEIILTYSNVIDISNAHNENANKGNFEIRFTWPYDIAVEEDENLTPEQIEDLTETKTALDTKWGYDIANFYEAQQEGDTEQGIEIEIQAIASQII